MQFVERFKRVIPIGFLLCDFFEGLELVIDEAFVERFKVERGSEVEERRFAFAEHGMQTFLGRVGENGF